MKFFDRIKNFFNRKSTKQLNSGEKTELDKQNDFANRIHYDPEPIYYKKLQGIDFAIEQYLAGLIFKEKNNMPLSSYGTLIELGAMTVNPNINEEKLLTEINRNKDINMVVQRDRNDDPAFYHVYKNKLKESQYRLYLNCKSDNLPKLVEKINDKLKDLDSYYFKFNAKEQMLKKGRSEQLVFYISDDKQINDIINKIRQIKKENPELWEGSENMNPFLKNIDGFIGYAPEVKSDTYNALDGTKHTIAKSYNSLLAEALEDSFTHSVRDIASRDYNLSAKLQGNYYYNMAPYVWSGVLSDIFQDEGKKRELINRMKRNLEIATDKNDKLEIKGINNDRER